MSVVRIKTGDDLPVISDILTYSDGTVPDLSGGTTVQFVMRGPWAASAKVDAAAVVLNQGVNPGGVQYAWQAADVDTPGEYRAEWQVTFGSGESMTFPTDGYLTVIVEEAAGDEPVRRLYCGENDLLLGDLEISSRVSRTDFIRRASRDVDILLSRKYVVPVPTDADQQTLDLLTSVTADLATAYVILAVASGGEDNTPNAYGMHLYKRAMNALECYITGDDLLGGVDVRTNPRSTTNEGPVGIRNEDSASLVAGFYGWVVPNYTGVPQQYPVSRPYDY